MVSGLQEWILDPNRPYIVLNEDTLLFLTHPLKLFYGIEKDQGDINLYQMVTILSLLKISTVGISESIPHYRNLINQKVVTKENFPNRIFVELIDSLPQTPTQTPHKPLQYLINNDIFKQLIQLRGHFVNLHHQLTPPQRLIDLVPASNRFPNGKDIRVFHGTNEKFLSAFKEKGILPSKGGGLLGPGFYFTPDIKKAANYLKLPRGSQLLPGFRGIFLEIKIRNADQLWVTNFKGRPIDTITKLLAEQTTSIVTVPNSKTNGLREFIVRDKKIVETHFVILRILIVNSEIIIPI